MKTPDKNKKFPLGNYVFNKLNMKLKKHLISSIMLLIFFTGCNFNYTESGKQVNIENDGQELILAKKSLKYIGEYQTDNLKELLNDDILDKLKPKQLDWLFTNGKRIMDNNEYPNDSVITVSYTTKRTISKEETFKEFNFPFINKNIPDSTMYFKITIANGEVHKLMLSTGMRFIK